MPDAWIPQVLDARLVDLAEAYVSDCQEVSRFSVPGSLFMIGLVISPGF